MTIVKICGLTNEEDALCAAEAGADLLGMIFYPGSPRFVDADRAARIREAVRRSFGDGGPRFVGVFVNGPVALVQTAIERVGLDLVQLHGAEPPRDVLLLSPRAYKAIRPQTGERAQAAAAAYGDVVPADGGNPQFLVDAYDPEQYGGTGRRADWTVARVLAERYRVLLAGGLDPEMVAAAIEEVRPWGVDVSSGVEREKGRKDHAKVGAFVQAVRAADEGS
ncbi:MAG: phosphoribosylanthranilate isomerase [Anaerolineales bacterium]|nr:MAG: phosphoribosylanthranilate isomerase [Anaerolineales bacterium]